MGHKVNNQKYSLIQIGAMASSLLLAESPESLVTSMNLLQAIMKNPGKDKPVPHLSNAGLSQIGKLLKNRNSTYNFTQEHRARDQIWSYARNYDVNFVMESVQNAKSKLLSIENQNQKRREKTFCLTPDDIVNRNQYLIKSINYSDYHSMMQINQGCNNYKKILSNRILKNNLNKRPIFNVKITNSEQKLSVYLKSMNQLFEIKSKLSQKQWTCCFRAHTSQKFWQILDVYSSCYPYQDFNKMVQKSLKMVESQLNASLPLNHESIIYYLTTNYLKKLQGKYESDSTLGPIWAICYVLYRAGRKNQFYRYLPDQKMVNCFKSVDESISMGNPQTEIILQQNGDVFHDQLILTLSGASKYSSEVLCDLNSLDAVWIFLRNVGIFNDKWAKFRQLGTDIYSSYKNQILNDIKIKNLFYLLCFQQLVQIGANQIMDQYDFLHFLIVLYHCPTFRRFCVSWQDKLQRKLTQKLLELIRKLFIQQKDEYLYYLTLLPLQTLSNQVSSLILKAGLQDKIKWKQIKKCLSEQIFEDLVSTTCEKYVLLNNDYLFFAEKVQDLLGINQKSCQLILQMFIHTFKNSSVSSQNLSRSKRIASRLLKNSQKVIRFKPIFQFFTQNITLLQLINTRNENQIYSFLKQCKHILTSAQLRSTTADIVWQLQQRQGFNCYVNYMKQIVKAYEICLTKMGRLMDLQQIQRMTLQAVKGLVDEQMFRQFSKSQAVLGLIRGLEEGLYRCSYD